MDINRFKSVFDRIGDNVNTVIHGKDDVVRLALVAICANGHVLFEDVPGVGKSMLARALGQSMDAKTARIQCTPDMLPGDITGSSIIETKTMNLVFKPGPVFTNILLVDEVNRATPKTQSAMLEAMAERNVSVEGVSHPLPKPFLVLATQNPVELAGTFPLPEAQLDRFLFRLTMGYPSLEAEKLVVRGNAVDLEVEKLTAVCTTKEIQEMIRLAAQVEVTDPVETYAIEITQATRTDPGLVMGASPRASIALLRASRALAAADGRQVVYPEDIKALLRPVLAHRLMLTSDATLRGETVDSILERVTSKVKPPLGVKASANGSNGSNGDAKPRRRAKVAASA